MTLVNFTNLDFDQIKQSIKDYLRSNSNFTDYDFEGSNLSVIIDTLAYNTYITSYNANMISNEVFIDSATLRENVVSLARNIGYVPRSRTAARSNISFFVDTSALSTNPVTLTLKKGTVCSSSNSFAGENYTFSIPSDITVPVVNGIAFFENIDIYEGFFVTQNFTVNSNNPNQRFILTNPNIDTSTINIAVRNTETSNITRKFILSNSLFDVNPNSKIFFIQEIEDQRYEVIFGDGIFGQKLSNLNYIDVSYIVTNGENGNGASNFSYSGRLVDNNNRVINTGISLITTNISSQSGKEIESVSSIKNYAPKVYATQNRAVTASDYETLIPQIYPEVESVSVFGGEQLSPPQYGKVFISIKPFNGPFVPNSVKDNLKDILKKYSVAGIVPQFLDLKYLYIEFETSIYYNRNLISDYNQLLSVVNKNIDNFATSSELNKYGSRFKYSKFLKLIDDSNDSITSNITKIIIRRDLKSILNQFADYEICYGNEFHIKSKDGFNIKSTGFTIGGTIETLYLTDIPDAFNTNGNNLGRIIFFKLTENGYVTVNNNAGRVDYSKGEIILFPVNFLNTDRKIGDDNFIEISAIPKSNDIVGLQDLYLQLDINKSKINIISDQISSGSDISGTNYVFTSSYTNGDLVRV
jgi:hypothetical protein